MIDQWYLIFFNLMFSAFPQLITGTLDKDVSAETLQQLPQLYVNGQNSEVRSLCVFVRLLLALKHLSYCVFPQLSLALLRLNTWYLDLVLHYINRIKENLMCVLKLALL